MATHRGIASAKPSARCQATASAPAISGLGPSHRLGWLRSINPYGLDGSTTWDGAGSPCN